MGPGLSRNTINCPAKAAVSGSPSGGCRGPVSCFNTAKRVNIGRCRINWWGYGGSALIGWGLRVVNAPSNSHADEYKAPMETATALSISGALRNPVNFWLPARLLSLDGRRWFSCTIRHFGGPLWITHAGAPAARCRARRSSPRSGRRSGSCAPLRRPGGWSQPAPHPQPTGVAAARPELPGPPMGGWSAP